MPATLPASPKNLSSSDGNDCKTNAASSTSPQPIDTKNQQDSDQQLQPTTTTISSTSQEDEYVLPSNHFKNAANQALDSHTNPPCCNNGGYARSRLFRGPSEALLPSAEDCYDGSVGSCGSGAALGGQGSSWPATNNCQQQLFSVTLHRAHPNGFGIAISGGCDNPHFVSGDPSIVVSDVIASGPAFGLVQINDRIVSANGLCLENAEYAMAVAVMKDAEQLNMIVKRRVPVPFVEFEQRTLKFTLSKSRKKDDFGIILGCKYYIKEITNPRLAEKEPGLKEGDTVLRVNGQTLEGVTLEEAARLLHRSREKLSLVVQRDVRRGSAGSRWPSQTTVYERLGSVSATPRHSPTPVHYTHSASNSTGTANASSLHQTESAGIPPASSSLQHNSRKFSADYSPGPKRFSDPMGSSNYQAQVANHNNSPQPFPQSNFYNSNNGGNNYLRQGQSPQMYNQQQQQGFNSNNYPAQTHTPSSSIISASSATNSPRNFAASTGSNSTAMANYAYYNQQLPQHPQQLQQQRDIRQVGFKKGAGGLGIRVIGGNQVGIFVSAVQEDSPAAQNGIKVGDRLHAVNNQNINGATREQAVDYLLALGDEVNLRVESSHNQDEFSHINGGQLGDSFYIRTHFPYSKRSNNKQELNFQSGDIFHVTDTLLGGKAGYWQVTKVYSVNESDSKGSHAGDMANGGIIPNSKTAEVLAKQARMDSSTLGRSIFRKRLQSRRTKSMTTTVAEDEFLSGIAAGGGNHPFTDIPLPAYERVALKKPAFHRPVVIYGPLADVARQLLLSNFGQRFGAAIVDNYMLQDNNQQQPGDRPIRMSSIDTVMASQRHCVLSISPGSVERLQLAQYAPIVVLIDVDSRNRIRDLRSKSGATTLSARKLMEQASKIKKHHAHLLTATLDASKEDGWFEALRHLIFHLQERRVWMPEFQPSQPIDDLLLFPMQNCNLAETPDDNKGDYGIYDATGANSVQATPTHRQNTTVDPAAVPALNIGGGVYAGPNSGPNASSSSIGGVSGGRVASNGSGSNSPFFAAFARSSPYSHSYRNVYGTTPTTNPGNYAENNYVTNQAPPTNTRVPGHPSDSSVTGYYDVKQILAEHYPEPTANSRPSRLSATSSPYAQQQQQSSSPRPPPFGGGNNRFSADYALEQNMHASRSPNKTPSQMGVKDPKGMTYDAPYIDDVQQRHTNDDFANNNNKDSIGASATVNYSLSPGKSLTNPGSISPAMRQSTSSINPAAADPIVIEHVHGVIDWKGGRLKCPESGVELIVPESAIPFGCQQELFVKVCRENQQNPPLDSDKQEALMSPLVMCGPQGIRFEVPVELKLPSNSPDTTSSQTSFVLKSGSGANWRNIELARPPKRNHPADKFVSVLVNHF